MADDTNLNKENENQETVASKKDKAPLSGRKKAILITFIIFVVLAIQVGTAYFFITLVKGDNPDKLNIGDREKVEKEKLLAMTTIGKTLDEPIEVTVNIAGSKGSHYLKTKIQLEWDSKEYSKLEQELIKRKPKITDIIIDILSIQSMGDLLQTTGKDRIRESILNEVNMIIPKEKGRLRNIFIQEFIIQ